MKNVFWCLVRVALFAQFLGMVNPELRKGMQDFAEPLSMRIEISYKLEKRVKNIPDDYPALTVTGF